MSDIEEYVLDFDELRKIYRLETKFPKLHKLHPDFYKALKKFLAEETKKYAKEMEDSFNTSTIKKLTTLKKMVEKISSIRLKKSMNLCLMYSRTSDFEDDNLIDFEVDFVKNIIKLIDKYNSQKDNVLGIKKKSKTKESTDLQKVEFLQDVPAFIGGDMKEYGPFEKGTVANLSKDICKILDAQNIITRVE